MSGKKNGFTLIELVMAIVLLGIIAGIGVPLLIAVNQGWLIARDRNQAGEAGMVAMERMLREIRMVNNDTSIIAADNTTLQFIDVNSYDLTFELSNNTVRRTNSSASDVLADNVNSLSFTYYDSNGSAIATPLVNPSQTDIRRIRVDFSLSADSGNLSFMSEVAPRNLNADY